ncbi:hypothetical protein [Streptosporangium sp. NPDC020145]|uniref:hypothetical protein n=1 Tax=Streptosporangium sp. NPDC020145 TaxID=3154694 RepID=UPI00344151B6
MGLEVLGVRGNVHDLVFVGCHRYGGLHMTWFAVDDGFHSHPKVMAADPAALGLWVIAGAWSCANLTDGFVPDHALPRLAEGARELAPKLVAVGLWRRARGGYRFHDWATYQESREARLKKREEWRTKKAKQRTRKESAGEDPQVEGQMSPGDTQGESPGESHGSPAPPIPSPIPSEEVLRTSSSSATESHDGGDEVRADVERICAYLADRIEANGSKRPSVTRRWRDAARLLLDKDGRTVDQVIACIDWCQADEFWRGNVLSMPKLRERYDQLRLAARRPHPRTSLRSTTDERVAQAQALKADLGRQNPITRGEILHDS